jgi:hypothetical protein
VKVVIKRGVTDLEVISAGRDFTHVRDPIGKHHVDVPASVHDPDVVRAWPLLALGLNSRWQCDDEPGQYPG